MPLSGRIANIWWPSSKIICSHFASLPVFRDIASAFLPGLTSLSFLSRPAALDTILLVRTIMSFSFKPPISLLAHLTMISAKLSPWLISGIVCSPITSILFIVYPSAIERALIAFSDRPLIRTSPPKFLISTQYKPTAPASSAIGSDIFTLPREPSIFGEI
ncbi:hypothetical protein ES703_53766 [subsurface metagenome]